MKWLRTASVLTIYMLLALSPGGPVPAQGAVAAAAVAPRTFALFKEPIEPKVLELPSGALAVWRDFARQKPALVIFSSHPLLTSIPEDARQQMRDFVLTAPAAEVVRRARFSTADVALTPPQTVSAAIDAGLLGELVFVQPTTREAGEISLAEFQQRSFVAGFLTEQEALALKLHDGTISGTLRGIPFRCVHPTALPKLDRPVIIHIDLGYFQDLYINDVKTPLYELLYQTARNIRAAGWPALAATLSYSNQEVEFSLETRFMISNLATILLHPELVDGAVPPSWKLRADARYLRAMYDETASREMIEKAAEIAPEDPDSLYALVLQLFSERRPDKAFSLLDRTVALDPGYALAYLELGETALLSGHLKKSMELVSKAQRFFPGNPFIRMSLADLLIRDKRGEEALPILHELQQLPWSTTYHPQVPATINQMLDVATGKTANPPSEKPSTGEAKSGSAPR